ncbi:hypothetical protein Y032_0046g1412 [Ancylostoma ceylanicum]|uniref:G-protein coupled receptors family 1 profile domain-containing protein n=1 Tax=Ancylostoma ceylanicum TaxID=53326 RepID=A0A016UCV0_9BILA|nr:hypothetical protein Y032_0046g1412 [Ancylostoma ceylanicum]
MFSPWRQKVPEKDMQDPGWYNRTLDWEDTLAGGSLIGIGSVSIVLYIVVMKIMRRQDKDIVGYRFLISAGFSDILLLFNYGVWPGLTILFKSEIIPVAARHWVQLYLDWAWFSMVWHYAIVGWSRWSAIRTPHSFRCQRRRASYALCGCCYFIALVEVLATHFQPWYVTFYYEPSSYGMLAEDFALYLSGGQSAMFLAYHLAAIIPPIIFYTWSLVLLINRRRTAIKTNTHIHMVHNHIESRLLLPCVINMIVFIVGQVVITMGTGEGKWAGCLVMLVFCTNSALNPILLLLCSETIRKQLLVVMGIRRSSFSHPEKCTSTIYRNPITTTRSKDETMQSPLMGVEIRLSRSPSSNSEPSTHV